MEKVRKYANGSYCGIMDKRKKEWDKISRAIYSVFIELYINQYVCLFVNVLFIMHILYSRANEQ